MNASIKGGAACNTFHTQQTRQQDMKQMLSPQGNPSGGTSTSKSWLFNLCYPLTGSLRASKMHSPVRTLPKARAFLTLVYSVKAAKIKGEILLQLSHSLVNEPNDERIPKEAMGFLTSIKKSLGIFSLANNLLLWLGIIQYFFLLHWDLKRAPFA